MKHQGITWNAIVSSGDDFDKTVAFFKNVFGLTATVEFPGFAMFPQAGGGILEVYAKDSTPDYGCNDGVAFGFRVDDIEAASAELAAGAPSCSARSTAWRPATPTVTSAVRTARSTASTKTPREATP